MSRDIKYIGMDNTRKPILQIQNRTRRDRRSQSLPCGRWLLMARCDGCDKEASYKASDVLNFEMEPPESFTPHPLFAEGGTDSPAVVDHRTSQD
jgi:hypothetical protein